MNKILIIASAMLLCTGFLNTSQITNTSYNINAVATNELTGSCGNNITWSFNPETGTLTIDGKGSINDYSAEQHSQPWYSFCDDITSVEFGEDIQFICGYLFDDCKNLKSVKIYGEKIAIYKNALGFYWDESINDYVKLENFVIYGAKSTIPKMYADTYGFKYVSLNDISNEVSVLDTLDIKKHILGISTDYVDNLDINKDKSINTLDLLNTKHNLL